MCGIAGQISLNNQPIAGLSDRLAPMSRLLSHRGPDGNGQWISDDSKVGLVHRRLAIIDL